MIYLASYEPGGSLYNREREHILGRSLLNFGLMKEYGRTWEVEQEAGSKPRLKGAKGVNLISAIQRVWWSALWRTERWVWIRSRFVRLRRA